jgi:hypothetical protein
LVVVLAVLVSAGGVSLAVAKSDDGPPSPKVTSGPANPTSSTSAAFAFTDSKSVTFQCSLDGSSYVGCGSGTSGSTSYSGLAAGSHTFRVRAQSGSKQSDPAVYSWLIDTTPPTQPTLSFDQLSANAFYGSSFNTVYLRPASGGSFRVTAQSSDPESGIASYTFSSLAGSGFKGSQSNNKMSYSFTGSATQPALDPTVYATNGAGLNSTKASYHLKKDTTPPAGGALAVNGTAATTGGSSSYNSTGSFPINLRTDYTEAQSATASGLASSTLTRQKAPLTSSGCGSYGDPTTITGNPTQKLDEGCYLYTLTGSDNVGNQTSIQTMVVVDQTPPKLKLSFPADGSQYNAAGWNAGCPNGFCGSATDKTGVANVQLSIQQNSSGLYWNGSSFASSSQVFVTTTLSSPNGLSTNWSYGFLAGKFPADGKYTLNLRGTDVAGNQTQPGDYLNATWRIDTDQPPAPVITEHPDNPSKDKNAHFKFNDTEDDSTFTCTFDGGTPYTCKSPQNFNNLPTGQHTFCVKATDPAGNQSSYTCFTWTITSAQTFTITGSPQPGVLLYPGGHLVPVNLTFTNPNSNSITVTSATLTITGTSAAGCQANDFQVAQQWSGSVVVPANSSQSLQGAGVPQAQWPQLKMIDNGNQNVCQNATINFSITGTSQ